MADPRSPSRRSRTPPPPPPPPAPPLSFGTATGIGYDPTVGVEPPPYRSPGLRASSLLERVGDRVRDAYTFASETLPGRVSDALGLSDLAGMARSLDEPRPERYDTAVGPPPFGSAEAKALAEAEHLARAPVERVGERLLVSPRILGTKGKKFVPAEPGRILLPTLDAAAEDPAFLRKLAREARRSPMLRPHETKGKPLDVLNRFADRGAENIDALFEMSPRAVKSRGGLWYPGGQGIGDEIAHEADVSVRAGPGVLSRLSPGTDWDQNISNAQRVGRWWKKLRETDQPFTAQHLKQFVESKIESAEEWIRTKKLTGDKLLKYREKTRRGIEETRGYLDFPWSELPPKQRAQLLRAHSVLNEPQTYAHYAPEGHIAEPIAMTLEGEPINMKWQSYDNLARALQMLDDPSDANISRLLGQGHKIRSFHNNLSVPTDPRSLTADVHNVAGTNLRPLGASTREVTAVTAGKPGSALTGIQGTYPLYQEATARAAKVRGLVPNAAQSIPWETTRGLFSPSQRSQTKFRDAATQLWQDYQRGKITLHETHARLHDLGGGVTPPKWASYPAPPKSKAAK